MSGDISSKGRRGKTKEEVTELKRSKGIISCAECRRLKLKCDKQIPCSHCKRRGCPSICPHGEFSLGYGNKHVLADREKLLQKLAQMSERIKHLEHTLRIAHGCYSSTRHSLLSDEYLAIKEYSEENLVPNKEPNARLDDVIDALGTLSISDERIERFLGVGGTAETVLVREDEPNSLSLKGSREEELPPGFLNWYMLEGSNRVIGGMTSDVKHNEEVLRRTVSERLPTRERATALCEAYLENISVFMRPIDRIQIYEELIPELYERDRQGNLKMSISIDDLGLALAVFACGATGDLTLPGLNNESAMYHRFALSCLSLKRCLDSEYVSLSTVQTACLSGFYYLFIGLPHAPERAWKVKCLVGNLAKSMGLHRDPSYWGFSEKQAERRRRVFWELYSTDHWQSLGTGRPPLIRASDVDCRLPQDDGDASEMVGIATVSAWSYRQHLVKEVISSLSEKISSPRAMKYAEVLEIDQKIRQFDVKSKGVTQAASLIAHVKPESAGGILRRVVGDLLKHFALIHVHRAFFAEAIDRNAENPTQSQFGPSFLAAFRSAGSVLLLLRANFDSIHQLVFRLWPLWNYAMTSAVVLAVVVARCHLETYAKAALDELNLAVEMFEKSTIHPVIRNSLPTITLLRNNARNAFYRHLPQTGNRFNLQIDRSDEALDILRGRARTIQSSKRRGRTFSLDSGRSSAAAALGLDTNVAQGSLTVPTEYDVPQMRLYAMDDWHIQIGDTGTPSSDGAVLNTPDLGQRVEVGFSEQSPVPTADPVEAPESSKDEIMAHLLSMNTSTSRSIPTFGPSSINNGHNNLNDYISKLLEAPSVPQLAQANGMTGVTGTYPASLHAEDLEGSMTSGADDSWRSLIVGSGLLGMDEYNILDGQSLQ